MNIVPWFKCCMRSWRRRSCRDGHCRTMMLCGHSWWREIRLVHYIIILLLDCLFRSKTWCEGSQSRQPECSCKSSRGGFPWRKSWPVCQLSHYLIIISKFKTMTRHKTLVEVLPVWQAPIGRADTGAGVLLGLVRGRRGARVGGRVERRPNK